MQKVDKFKAFDDTLWDTKDECLKHEDKVRQDFKEYQERHKDDCSVCSGSGQVEVRRIMSDSIMSTCGTCGGSGKIKKKE